MSEPQDYEALFLQNLPYIQTMCATFCRRDRLDADETDDFTSWAMERVIENDYAVIRKFRGESLLTTYLTMVLSRLFHDHRVARWGRWRPSAEARRQGDDAMALERLVYRDRYTFAQAVEHLRSSGRTRLSEQELRAIFASLPAGTRGRPTPVGEAPLAYAPADGGADHDLLAAEADAARARVAAVVNRVVDALPPEDGVILRMRVVEGSSVADIARALRLDQKPLYRRIARLLAKLRDDLEDAGISRQDFLDMFGESEE